MKKIFAAFFICFLALPCFAIPNYDKAMERIGGQPRFCDDSDSIEYRNKLEKAFDDKYKDVFTGEDYTREVMIPYFKFTGELQKQGHCGFED